MTAFDLPRRLFVETLGTAAAILAFRRLWQDATARTSPEAASEAASDVEAP